MTEHLPECQRFFTDMPAPDDCPACGMFRVCEQRVRGEERIRAAGIVMDTRKAWRDPDMAWTLIERIKAKP